jgi:murein DD-endopeptidase MepM/ murein hydrolase activator NlpD
MPRVRSNNRIFSALALCAIVALCAAPALAAETAAPGSGTPVGQRFDLSKVVHWAQRTARAERHRAERAQGPFVPIVGPVDYGTAENAFGAARSGHVHAGQDMFAKPGTPEIAVTDGVIAEAGSDASEGNYVYLYDPKLDRTYVYMHMIEPAKVRDGQSVDAGQLLGGVGCTGSCWGDHLHFEVRAGRGYEGEPRDPMPLLRQWRSLDQPR